MFPNLGEIAYDLVMDTMMSDVNPLDCICHCNSGAGAMQHPPEIL